MRRTFGQRHKADLRIRAFADPEGTTEWPIQFLKLPPARCTGERRLWVELGRLQYARFADKFSLAHSGKYARPVVFLVVSVPAKFLKPAQAKR
ncbi:hypothetical protein [Paraburkholderia sp. MM5482-R1]|uniref:hypothetical protein n=1 Tax=unclassified Paraburkholderia TaxID=2615204 RepID=UPI003D19C7BB